MTQPRRPDEVAFYNRLREAARTFQPQGTGNYWGGIGVANRASRLLLIPAKRANYLLEKWYSKGWIECGLSPWGGWFTELAPEKL